MLAGTRTGGPSVLAEADGGDHIGKLACLPRLTVVFRDVNLSPETDGGTTAQGIEVPGVDPEVCVTARHRPGIRRRTGRVLPAVSIRHPRKRADVLHAGADDDKPGTC